MTKLLLAAASAASVAALFLEGQERRLPPRHQEAKTGQILVTTGFWRLTNDDSDIGELRNGPGGYMKRMHFVMTLNVPLHIYGDDFGVKAMKEARGKATPALVGAEVYSVQNFEPCKSHDALLRSNLPKYTHPKHMHAITLGCIWDGKFSLIAKTARDHPGYKWYGWLDIGMHGGPEFDRVFSQWGSKPWPNPGKLNSLPRDRITVSKTGSSCSKGWGYCHIFAATAIIQPSEMVENLTNLFYEQVENCIVDTKPLEEGYPCLNEQVMMTQMERNRPGTFNTVGQGYGAVAAELAMAKGTQTQTTDLVDFLSSEDPGVLKLELQRRWAQGL